MTIAISSPHTWWSGPSMYSAAAVSDSNLYTTTIKQQIPNHSNEKLRIRVWVLFFPFLTSFSPSSNRIHTYGWKTFSHSAIFASFPYWNQQKQKPPQDFHSFHRFPMSIIIHKPNNNFQNIPSLLCVPFFLSVLNTIFHLTVYYANELFVFQLKMRF